MFTSFSDKKIAIVGAGKFCVRFLEYFYGHDNPGKKPDIVGVSDRNIHAPGIALAASLGIPTTTDYREFADADGLQAVLEMSNDPTLSDVIAAHMPAGVRIIDHYEARSIFDLLLLEKFRDHGMSRIREDCRDPAEMKHFLDDMLGRFARVLDERNQRSRQIVGELWEQEEFVSQVIEGSTVPTFVIDRHHQVIHWNKALERLTGVAAGDVIGTHRQWFPFYKAPRPSLADLILDQVDIREFGRLYDGGCDPSPHIEGAYQAEAFFEDVGGTGKWLFFTAAPIVSRDGRVIGAIETFWDTTEDKRQAQERARKTQELSTLVDLYTALSGRVDFENRLNNAFRVICDFMDAVSGCFFLRKESGSYALRHQFGNADCNSEDTDYLARMAASGKIILKERSDPSNRINDPDSQCTIYVPVSDKGKNPLGLIFICSRKPRAVAERERKILDLMGNRIGVAVENEILNEQFIRSEEKYRTLFNNDPTPIFILDSQTRRIIDMNQRAEATYGYLLEELRDTPFTALGDDDEEIVSALDEIPREKSILLSKKRHYKKDGHPFYVTIVISTAEYGGKAILIVNTADITEIMEKEAQLIQAGKMTTLGVMAAGMAHEINQPLNVIQICADYFLKMLKKGESIPTEDVKSMALNIVENVDRATKVIRRVRDFARQTDVVRNEIHINDPIEDSLKVVNYTLTSHQIKLVLELADDLPPVLAEHNRLEQVFINLITNAADAIEEKAEKHPDRPIEKVITIKSFCEKGEVVVMVSDTGAGMSEHIRERIFEPFFTTKETNKGTGLGVSISYGIVKDYNGNIEVGSNVGKGTTFRISFPPAGGTEKECP